MITYYKTIENKLVKIKAHTHGAWINVVNPTQNEIDEIESWGIPREFIIDPLDVNERARTERDMKFTFILSRIPYTQGEEEDIPYITIPFGIILFRDYIITICSCMNDLISRIIKNKGEKYSTVKRNRFILQIMLANASLYLDYLREINSKVETAEDELQRSVHNRELLELLKFQKSLVYFSTALKSNELIFERLSRQKFFISYPDDADLLEDVIIENLQALEMTNIASNLLVQMMDAFASLIQNNQNIIFKIMTALTIILSLPTIISGYWGMNVGLPMENNPNSFIYLVLISLGIMLMLAMYFKRIDWL
ncbi:MAG: magnesium transporter CorA family protein [Anaerolineaceae bacterium]|nr:magnesium transporter CorA family protein [Anaerolineaceae bacterium]